MRTLLLLAVVVGSIAGCGLSGQGSKHSEWKYLSPVGVDAASIVASLDRDYLQYPVAKRDDGTEMWNADYVYFYLVREADLTPALDEAGKPLASGLLHSEAARWMEGKTPIPGTVWRWRVMRTVRELKNANVVNESPFTAIDDADLPDLLSKDKLARQG